ncbi:MAG: hypothetical protein ACRCUY_00435 [Thermoguttaceae bacterium]
MESDILLRLWLEKSDYQLTYRVDKDILLKNIQEAELFIGQIKMLIAEKTQRHI